MLGYILSASIVGLAILGARIQNDIPLFIMLALIVLTLILVLYEKIKPKQYPILIYFTTLGLVYQLTFLSNYIVGTDIHYEFYYALQTYLHGHWDYTIGHSYNASMSVNVFLPMLAKTTHIGLEWAFKIIPPLFLSGIPVIAYYIFRKEFKEKAAFLSTFFFISVPTMFLELSGLAKQEFGELFLIACLGLIAYNVPKLQRVRYPLIALFGILTIISHYSMGGALFCYLVGVIPLFLIGKYLFKMKPDIKLIPLVITSAVIIVFGIWYYGTVTQGLVLKDITDSMKIELNKVLPNPIPIQPISTINPNKPDAPPSADEPIIVDDGRDSPTYAKHWRWPEPAIALATGLDFARTIPIGKVFRVFQYITEILIIVGTVSIFINFRKYSLGYLAFVVLSGLILIMTIFFPGFSPILNASRFYNLALLFLSPSIVVGGKIILRNYKTLAFGVFIPYFAFTSGAVFELTRMTDVSTVTIPYSHALSAIRTDSTALFTVNDIKARNYVNENNLYPLYGDMWGATALSEVKLNLVQRQFVFYLIWDEGTMTMLPIADNTYVFLRERNTEKQELTFYVGVGMRLIHTYDETKIKDLLEGRKILYQVGNAIVYGQKEI